MSKLFFSSTQVYRTAPTIGGIMLVGSVLFYKEQHIYVLLLQYSLFSLIFAFTKSLREFFKIKKSSLWLVIVVSILSFAGQVGVAFALSEALENIFLFISFTHALTVGIFFFLIFNPAKLSKMGWVDLDK